MAPKTKEAATAKKGTKKDKEAPKRPLSAYMFFSRDQRERTKAENPTASFGEIGRILGATWKEMSESQKKPYIDMAERDKVRAETEKAAYNKKK